MDKGTRMPILLMLCAFRPARPSANSREAGATEELICSPCRTENPFPRWLERWIGSTRSRPAICVPPPRDGIHAGSGYLIPYRVQIEGDNLEVTMQPSEWQPGAWSLNLLKSLPCVLVPVIFAVVLGWFGARIARRLFPPKPARPTVPS
jgi:hypothetical protein